MSRGKIIIVITVCVLLVLSVASVLTKDRILAMISTGSQQKGLVGHWALDGVTGAKDLTPNGNDGTGVAGITIGGATDQHGQANRATNFDGWDDGITSFASDPIGTNAITISVWFNIDSAGEGDAGRIISNGKTILLFSGATRLGFASNGVTYAYSADNSIATGSWYHVTVTRTASGVANFYINGSLSGTGDQSSGSPAVGTLALYIGDENNTAMDGRLADFRIYNRALTATQVTDLYNKYRPKTSVGSLQKGLVGHWALDGVTGAKDLTPNGNHGTGAGGITIGGATDQHGQAGRATTFDISNDSIEITNSSIFNLTSFSVSFWWNGASVTGWGGPFMNAINGQNGFQIVNASGVTNSYIPELVIWNGTAETVWRQSSTAYSVPFGQFKHFTWTYNGLTAILYVDGSVVTNSASAVTVFAQGAISIGRGYSGGYVGGNLSDVRVYNRALSATEATSLYNQYRPKYQISSLYKGLVLDMPLAQQDLKSATTIADKTPYGNTGTLVGSPTFTTDRKGQANKAMSFDGSSQYILNSTADFRSGDSAGTISVWIKHNNVFGIFFMSGDEATNNHQINLLVHADGRIRVEQTDDGVVYNEVNSVGANDTSWHHVAVVSSGTAWSIYVDGVVKSVTVASGSNNGNWFADTLGRDNFIIGAYKTTSLHSYFNGSIANVKVWNRALSATEVTSLYNSYR